MPSTDPQTSEFFRGGTGIDLLPDLDTELLPKHVAIIMDGNGRWAKSRGLPRLAGHRAGVKAVREAIACCLELGVEVLTVYSFSSENWTRPLDEVSGLMDLFVEVLQKELVNLEDMEVRVVVAGDMSALPPATRNAFQECVARTADFNRMTLVVAINYGGRQEIIAAAKRIAEGCRDMRIQPDDIDEQLISDHLYTAGIPDPDLVIRTSGELRFSNFLLWQIAYAEFWITDRLWPEFDRHELLRAIIDFQRRDRRYGGSP